MNRIEEMIKETPIIFQALEDVGSFYNGVTGKSKKDFEDGNAKFISYMNVFSNQAIQLDIDVKVQISEGEKQNTISYGDIIFTTSSETPDECGMSSVLTEHTDEKLYLNSFCFGFRFNDLSNICPSFYKHYFRSQKARAQIAKTANGVTRYNISKKLFGKIEIPLPPLPIQQEIVKILDSFTALQQNLEDELKLRQKQYEHYREKLLTFEEGELMKVSDFCDLKAGKAIKASELSEIQDEEHQYPCYGGNGIRGYINKCSHHGDYAIIGRQGALCGCVNWASGDFYATEHAVVVTPKNQNNSRFLNILFTFANLNQYKSQGAQPGLAVSNLNELSYTIPTLDRQLQITQTLDHFESLISNIKTEIELRKKQYEYYREKLLTL